MNTKVFISYASVDKKQAKQIAKTLSGIHIKYFLDSKHINWGDDITGKIAKDLASSSHVIVLVSPASLKSKWVQYEVGYASALGKRILPFLSHPSLDLPDYLNRYQYKTRIAEIKKYFETLLTDSTEIKRDPRSQQKLRVNTKKEGDTCIEPFFWLAQTLVGWVTGEMELFFQMFEQQANDLSLEILDRNNTAHEDYLSESLESLRVSLMEQHGQMAADVFSIATLVALLPHSFDSTTDFRRAKVAIETAVLKAFVSAEVLQVTTGFLNELPCEIPQFVDRIENYKKELQRKITA